VSRASRPVVPFVDLERIHAPVRADLDAAIAAVVERNQFVLGPEVAAFEQEWAAYCGTDHAVGTASGTAAIRLVLEALGVGPGDEVIVPAATFIASALPVLHLGARPRLVDCEPETSTLDPALVEDALTERTKAIVAVHLYGQPADLEPLGRLADAAGVALIEDAAQAHGARYRGRLIGSFGRAACFSFYPSKNLGAFGDAGAVVTNDGELAEWIRRSRDLGQVAKYEHVLPGHNERLDTIQAAVLLCKLRHLDGWNEARRATSAAYRDALRGLPLDCPVDAPDREHVWHLYVIRLRDRDHVRARLSAHGIGTGLHYPLPLHLEPVLTGLGHARGDFPVAEDWSDRGLSIPMFAGMEGGEVDAVASAIGEALA
jgi:dTDP-4-amino-4,6-dideoxygalactose transaminase